MKKSVFIIFYLSLFCWVFPVLYQNELLTITDLSVKEKKGEKEYRAWLEGDSLHSNYEGEEILRKVRRVPEAYPEFSTGYPLIDMLYALAIHEIELDINEKGYFTAGEKWTQAWTRDMSYAIWLSLAASFPQVSADSLKTRIFNGNILQDTGTGGSYPISTDRVVWTLAAYETALFNEDASFYHKVYEVSKKAMLQDIAVVYHPKKKLFKGEESFLDWREQTYPKWMHPGNIGESYASGTNILHYMALQKLSLMAKKLGFNEDKKIWDTYAAECKEGINSEFWLEQHNYYAAYTIGGTFPSPYSGYETLGNALSILCGLREGETAVKMLNALKTGNYGFPVVAPQFRNIPPYHNNSVWPFVQGYRALAAAKAGDNTTFSEEFFTMIRGAALFGTFKENLVATNGNRKTQLNSDRQLWSAAAYLGIVYRGIIGLDFQEDGIHLRPMIPNSFQTRVRLNRFRYHNALLNLEVHGNGSQIQSIFLDGKEQEKDYFIPADIQGNHTITIILSPSTSRPRTANVTPLYDSLEYIKVVETLSIIKENNQYYLKWAGSPDKEYAVFRNGEKIAQVTGLTFPLEEDAYTTEYSISEISGALPLIKGVPLWRENKKDIFIAEAESAKGKGGKLSQKIVQKNVSSTKKAVLHEEFQRFAYNGKGYIAQWGKEKEDFLEFTVKVPEKGVYIIDFRYQNGGPINTGEKCALRELDLNQKNQGVIFFPHMGNLREWAYTAELPLELNSGINKIKIYNSERTLSQKEVYNPINIDLVRVRRIK